MGHEDVAALRRGAGQGVGQRVERAGHAGDPGGRVAYGEAHAVPGLGEVAGENAEEHGLDVGNEHGASFGGLAEGQAMVPPATTVSPS
ncbi:hypothetical protein ATOP_08800 [Granulimonas faecalis]|uniref:Uncharacterized protein n=1 Tax=Granulimonas faecalis TaxID=2894155 RepID=A0AAV5B355_9ACTN|nr:hypothetical protein ATOP_08800 [Granulimonas faecalis]